MKRKYSLKLDGRFAGHYEIFSEEEIIWLRMYFQQAAERTLSPFTGEICEKLIKVLEIRTLDE